MPALERNAAGSKRADNLLALRGRVGNRRRELIKNWVEIVPIRPQWHEIIPPRVKNGTVLSLAFRFRNSNRATRGLGRFWADDRALKVIRTGVLEAYNPTYGERLGKQVGGGSTGGCCRKARPASRSDDDGTSRPAARTRKPAPFPAEHSAAARTDSRSPPSPHARGRLGRPAAQDRGAANLNQLQI